MFRSWLSALAALLLVSGSATAQMAFVEGNDYQLISPPVQRKSLFLRRVRRWITQSYSVSITTH